MFRPRVIPVLLLKNLGLVKSIKFRDYRYIGDPINAVKLFNDLGADELVFLDILASNERRSISLDFVKRVGDEANMPFSVGGGIRSLTAIKEILSAGAEKVILNTIASENPSFVKEASEEYGSSTIVVSIDVNKSLFGKELVYNYSGRKVTKYDPVSFARLMEDNGAGEIIINSIEHDGMMNGYDISLIKRISETVRIPVVALGGASNNNDLRKAVIEGYASAVAAGSLFVFHGARRAVLVNYPTQEELINLFHEDSD
jgi:imidazole glycerol-phosphate synthase subunit HisF